MSGPPSGKYRIQLAAGSRPFIGADGGPAPVKPVILEGINSVVSPLVFVQRQRPLYHLFSPPF
jgi:hypothetical protein